jgi:hypothetical protein
MLRGMHHRGVSGIRRNSRLAHATQFALDPLERRLLMCTLEGVHFEDFHGPEATESEPNDTPATATPFGTGESLVGTISGSGDVDWWSGSLGQGARLQVRAGTDPGQRHYKPLIEIVDASGSVMMRSPDGRELNFFAPTAGTYFVKISSQHAYGTFTGSYGADGGTNLVTVAITNFSGISESEPNDTIAAADFIGSTTTFRGNLATSAESDYFSFTASAGNAIAVKFTGAQQFTPSVRLYNTSNALVATDTGGAGVHFVATAGGTYKLQASGDNSTGAVTGDYSGSVVVVAGPAITEVEPANRSFSGAVPWALSTATNRAAGTLGVAGDVDFFSVDLRAGRWYSFSIDTGGDQIARGGRQLAMYNEFGQLMEASYTGSMGTNAATGFGFRVERTGKHYLAVSATGPTGVGGYIISGSQTSTFPTQRDVPLVFHDYTGQRTHLGYGPAAPLVDPADIPLMVGMFEARYDLYDVDVTTAYPGGTFLGFGAGEFGSIGAYGYGGSFSLGSRRASGDSVLDDSGSTFTSLYNIRRPASVMNQEVGHAAGLYAHARNALGFMAYDSQSAMNVVGTYYPFPWTDSRVPDVETRNEREQQDWIMQSGRIAEETEPNDSLASPQNLAGHMSEMTADGTPRNDRVALAARIDSSSDSDYYSFTAAAGQTFAMDIDAAEFQHPLDARVEIYDASNNLLAGSFDALDRESGMFSVDPYLVHTFGSAGTYRVRVFGENGTFGNYRLKLTSGAAFDSAGPRAIASFPNGGAGTNGTRQLLFWFNDQIDPTTITSANISVQGSATGLRSGGAVFDPVDGSLIWLADAQLPPDSYTVTFKNFRDLRGNLLDGETDGSMGFPEISGDGNPGGDFTTTFTITSADTTPAAASAPTTRRHPYNRVLFTLDYNDELDIQSVYGSNLKLRGAGGDNSYETSDDYFVPIDLNFDKIRMTSQRQLEAYTRGVPDFGNYRLEGSLLDAAGNTVNVSSTFSFSSSQYSSGPSVADVSVQPGTAIVTPLGKLDLTFSQSIDPATLTAASLAIRYSPDATFFDGNDSYVVESDGAIAWDPTNLTATFESAGTLPDGYYLIELDGDTGGIATTAGALLDGDWLDSSIAGNSLFSHWNDAPSGDGFAGGDYQAMFRVQQDVIAPTIQDDEFLFLTAPQNLSFRFSENVGDSLSVADLVLQNLTTGQTISPANLALTFDPSTATATFTWPGLASGVLSDGNYRATLLASGITDPAGNALAADHAFDVFFVMADADHNGQVNSSDFNILATNFGLTNRNFSHGDFNYDTVVNSDDFNILATRFGISLGASFSRARIGMRAGSDTSPRSDALRDLLA